MSIPRTPAKTASARVRALLLAGLSALGLAAAPQSAAEKQPFPHDSHVSRVWFNRGAQFRGDPTDKAHAFDKVEVARDCRGCHDFGARDAQGNVTRPARSPLDTCSACHEGGVIQPEIAPGFEAGLRAGRGSRSAFEHLDHDDMACRACHDALSDESRADMTGKTGVPACVECHTQGGEKREYEALSGRTIERDTMQARFLAWLNADPSMSLANRGPYPHDRHLAAAKLADAAACRACHADVEDATADDLHLKEYTAEQCADCHVQSNGRPVTVDRAVERRPSVAARTFAHADHLGTSGEDRDAASPGARAKIDAEGCLACHAHSAGPVRAPDGSPLPATFVLRADRDDYQGCLECHDVPRFRATNHGEWARCTGCHSFGEGDPKTLRPSVAVERAPPRQVTFLMDEQAHPGISGKPAEKCDDCHRAALPALPSRIAGQRFEHASHLGGAVQAGDCRVCHAGVAASDGTAAIGLPWDEAAAGAAEPARRVTFDVDGCAKCHPGIRIDPASLAAPARREIVAFSHADHLEKSRNPATGQPVTCSTCHDFDATARGREIGVRADALTCVQCHQHDEQRAPWTGGIHGSAIASCAQCHTSGLPRIDSGPEVDRVRVALQGAQHHPPDRGCFECHVESAPGRLEPVSAVLATFRATGSGLDAEKARSPHRAAKDGGRAFVNPEANCQDCHWAIRKNAVGAPRTKEQRDLVGALTGDTRQREGNNLLKFPGGKARAR